MAGLSPAISNAPPAVRLPAPGEPIAHPAEVRASATPAERLAQLDGFFRRNPGYAATSATLDGVRSLAAGLPVGRSVTATLTPTELGYGQLLHDQMEWQARSTRQPENRWWMEMNAHLVEDPLKAESLVRSGRAAEAPNPSVAAWVKYIESSDAVAARLGLPAGASQVVSAAGDVQPRALSDVSRSAPLGDRLVARAQLMEQARAALWNAHRATLEVHYGGAAPALREVAATMPREAKFASGWANIVGYLAKVNPMATGRGAVVAQHLLADHQLADTAREPALVRSFADALSWLDRSRFAAVIK